jgi:hypothetical protein
VDWVLQWLALTRGLVAAATFTADRSDKTRADAAAVYVIVTLYQASVPRSGVPGVTKYVVHNDGPLPLLGVASRGGRGAPAGGVSGGCCGSTGG